MREMSVREVRSALTKMAEIVEREGEVVVTRHGKAIARILPLGVPRTMPSHAELRGRTKRLSPPSEALVREDRDGR